MTTTRHQWTELVAALVSLSQQSDLALHDATDMKTKFHSHHTLIISFTLLWRLASGFSEDNNSNRKSVKSYTLSRLTFSYDGTEKMTTSDWSAGRFAEGSAVKSVEGSLVLPASVSSCERKEELQSSQYPSSDILVLVRRGNCSFDEKVLSVKHLRNIIGVIIYNDREQKGLSNIYVNETSLPVIFTSLDIGENLTEILSRGDRVNVSVSVQSVCSQQQLQDESEREREMAHFHCVKAGQEGLMVNQWEVLCIAVAFFILAVVSVTSFIFYYLKRLNRAEKLEQFERKKKTLARKAVAQLELGRMEEGEEGEEGQCSVCLEPVSAGQETRRLPCSHTYHRSCVDRWLLQKRKCPLCKLDILQYFSGTLEDSDTE